MNPRRRRTLAVGAAIALAPRLPCAQAARRIPTVGILWHAANAKEEEPYYGGVLEGFREAGYVEGRNIRLLHRFPNEEPERFARMAAELVEAKVDVLIGVGANSSLYAKAATATIPVIFMYVPDPVGAKLVQSLSRPGGNATGLTNSAVELTAKRLQYLQEILPQLSRAAMLVNPSAGISRLYREEAAATAAKFHIDLRVYEAPALESIPAAFSKMAADRMQAVIVNPEGLFFQGREALARLARERRLPLCVWSREMLEAGALISYGADQVAISRRVAVYVDRILKGAKPAEIPVEQPTKFEFLINTRTAAALGIALPNAVILRANALLD